MIFWFCVCAQCSRLAQVLFWFRFSWSSKKKAQKRQKKSKIFTFTEGIKAHNPDGKFWKRFAFSSAGIWEHELSFTHFQFLPTIHVILHVMLFFVWVLVKNRFRHWQVSWSLKITQILSMSFQFCVSCFGLVFPLLFSVQHTSLDGNFVIVLARLSWECVTEHCGASTRLP